jgi:hypothetical protein
MKVTVITDSHGKIVGTMKHTQQKSDALTVQITPGHGQKAQELDLPVDFAMDYSAEEFHKAIQEHLRH